MSTETEAEQLRNLLQGSDATSVKKIPENYKATTATKLKTVLQGLSFGSSDEIEAL